MKLLLILISVLLLLLAGVSNNESLQRALPQAADVPIDSFPRKRNSDGAIEGRVINSAGESVAGASVFAESETSRTFPGKSRKDGTFRIVVPKPGTYTIYGSKEVEGYPPTISGFHRPDEIQLPVVGVTEKEEVITGITVQLGEKAANLEIIIKEAESGRPIENATFTLRRADNPNIFYTVGLEKKQSGRFKLLVPTSPFGLEIQSPGHMQWFYSKPVSGPPENALRLNRGATKTIEVVLHRNAVEDPLIKK